ncbi:hypothetical protein J0S82_004672 [Galemys pyrenaicus]|uniref:Uncharacterized protein n=1 Tax=Galemys pyrenaicus TaxID=202257 RepID=A0A8J6A0Q9_GALPY|nr:hypothetical protein J0S82_004672 [Galemys pyrenaicus]
MLSRTSRLTGPSPTAQLLPNTQFPDRLAEAKVPDAPVGSRPTRQGLGSRAGAFALDLSESAKAGLTCRSPGHPQCPAQCLALRTCSLAHPELEHELMNEHTLEVPLRLAEQTLREAGESQQARGILVATGLRRRRPGPSTGHAPPRRARTNAPRSPSGRAPPLPGAGCPSRLRPLGGAPLPPRASGRWRLVVPSSAASIIQSGGGGGSGGCGKEAAEAAGTEPQRICIQVRLGSRGTPEARAGHGEHHSGGSLAQECKEEH